MSDKCDSDVYENGAQVFITHTLSSKDVEKWVKEVAKESGQKVDWHYAGGRAVVLALGKLKKVNAAIVKLRPIHDELFRVACLQYIGSASETERIIDGIWQYNGLNK